ncbi:hypothetical protein BK124_11425 [Paenibacillus amylolyticus]|uniref:hypothetical protein n=1 Tax=Paenibacillus amylolyticus TaxID=1451 RepID=UPI00096E0C26|nr:hypothetical protein [Paenibacillus amylolyticus]OMF00263.1 hypothetical protein BK124_11425 [Paenibacillus amylolyticus]
MKLTAKVEDYTITITQAAVDHFDVEIVKTGITDLLWFTKLSAAKRWITREYGAIGKIEYTVSD